MPKQTVQYKDVVKAATLIKREGKKPSVTNICKKLGLVAVPQNLPSLLEKWYHNQPEFKRKKTTPLIENIHTKNGKQSSNETQLQKSLSLLRATLESTADGIMMVNGKGQVVDWNQKFVEMWRIPTDLMEAGPEHLSFDYILDQLTNPQQLLKDVSFLYEHPEWEGKLEEIFFKDGRIFERFTQPQRIGKEIVGRVYSFHDVTARFIADEELRLRDRALEASSHGVIILDVCQPNYPIIYNNRALENITGFSEKEILGRPFELLQVKDEAQANQKRIILSIREHREESVEIELLRKDLSTVWCEISVAPVKDRSHQIKHYVCIINDISQRREMEQQLLRQATHDALTDLPNRVLLVDRVEQGILQASMHRGKLAFIFLDLDHFKMINDTLGHTIGDKLLQAVASRLLVATKDFDTIVRFGGDEFVIIRPAITDIKEAEQLSENILTSIRKPFKIDKHTLKITASMGISIYPKDGKNYETLMKNADLSMYHAKDSGRNTYRVFDNEMNQRVVNHVQLENALNYALQKNELYLVYQPLVELKTGNIIGVEALLRWNSSVLGPVPPLSFIPIAEENGLIIEIGAWVLKEACFQLLDWQQKGITDLKVSVNISAKQLYHSYLPDIVQDILNTTGINPACLDLELTETILMDDMEQAVASLYQFKDMGVQLSIDDFGTGYSSLSYLKQFPVDVLKIDQSFVREMVNEENDASIVKAIINLGHSLNLKVLAEGVENEYQRNFILTHGCDYAQGYFYKPPSKADEIVDYLRAKRGSFG